MARKNFIFKYGIDIAPNSNGIGTVFTVNNRTGNIGFGTTNPTSKIHVVGTISADNFTGNSSYALQAGIATNVSGGTASVTQLNVSGITTLGIVTAGNIFSTGIITASSFSGNASSATQLQNSRNFSVTGDFITAPSISFNGTGNVALAATITADSIVLGTYTSGDYVKNISGTTNQITVTGGTGEGSIPTISLPNQFTAPQDVTITRDLQVNRNLSINGTVTIGGTSATIFSQELKVGDPDIILGFRTDGSNNDISTDNTANHGGVALASTEGSPLVQLFIAGIETNPSTYKKIMWFKKDSFTGLGTDAWLINYAVGIGSTQFPSGTRLAAGSVQFTENDLAVVRNINSSGIITGTLANTLTLNTSGTGLSGSTTYNNSGAATFTVTSNATSANTGSTIVARDASGNFSAGTITATLSGTATTTTNIPNLTGDITSNGTITSIASGVIVNDDINASAAIAVSKLAASTISGVTLGNNLSTLTLSTSGTGLSGSTTYNGSGAATFTVTSNATSANTGSTIVARDASGNFSAGTITATSFSGNLANTLTLNTSGTGLSGSTTYNNSGAATFTVTSNATSANTANAIVARDASGNFSMGALTAGAISGTTGTFSANLVVDTSGTSTSSSTIVFKRSGQSTLSFGSYAGSWRTALQLQNNDSTKLLFLAPPENDSAFGILKAVNGGLKIDVGSSGATNAISIDTSGNISIPVTLTASADQAIVNQHNGNAGAWYGRILSKNSTNDRAAFLGTYASIAGVFAHNNALNAWADLYVNTVDGSGGGTVRMPSSVLVNGNQVWHAGNDGAGSGLDADLLDGYSSATTATGNTIVLRDGNGDDYRRYGFGSYFNSTDDVSSGTITYLMGKFGDNYYRSATAAKVAAFISGQTLNISGTSSSAPLLSALGNYVWSASTLPTSYSQGIQCSFVQASNGWQNYGSVMTMNTYSGGGGALQMFVPYSPTYGGTGLQVRFGNYDVSSGNSWTSWKTLLASDNYTGYSAFTGEVTGTIFKDYNNPSYYLDPASTSVLYEPYVKNAISFPTSSIGVSSRGAAAYNIYQEGSAWTSPFPDLCIGFHTGLSFGANVSYGGMRFFTDYDLSTLVMQINGSSNYIYKYYWLYTNTTGMYSDSHGAHIYPNSASTYTQWRIDGSKNSYGGIYDSYSAVNIGMYDSAGNGGVYREANGRWFFYHLIANNCMGVNTSTTSSSYGIYVSGGVYSTGNVVAYSDARKKTDIQTVTSALNKVNQLRGVTYRRIDLEDDNTNSNKVELGVVAQEVEPVLPEVVTYAKDIDEYGVSYGNFAGLFIEAFKEQTIIINNLKKEVEELKSRLGN